MVEQLSACCGVGEIQYLEELRTPQEALKEIGDCFFAGNPEVEATAPYAQMIFTEVAKIMVNGKVSETKDYGAKLAAEIKKHKLGIVQVSKPAINPQHAEKHDRHYIRTYLWTPSKKALKAYWKAQGGEVYKEPLDAYTGDWRW